MHQAIQMPRRLLDRLPHVVIAIEVENIRHQVKGILVVLNVRVEAGEVEAVGEVVFVYFAEVLVAS